MLQPQQTLSVPSTSGHPLHYQLQRKLGRTATGRQTWLATDLDLNESVTLKLLAFNPQMDWNELKLFEREAEVLQALHHPCIPQYRHSFCLDRDQNGGIPWFGLVQDYIPGASLQDRLDQGEHFEQQQVIKIAAALLDILIYLHSLSPPVLHRDIKPSNIILGEDQQIYLVDFGAVQSKVAVTGVTFTVVGTSGYAPLEQFWGRAVPASDLYALGATLVHLATGVTPADLPHRENRIQFKDRVSLPPHLITWLERLTDPALEKRFATAQEALEQLYAQATAVEVKVFEGFRHVPKPQKSQIEVWRLPNSLKLEVPSRFQRHTLRTLAIIFLGLMMARGLFLGLMVWMPTALMLLVGSLGFTIIGLLFAASHVTVSFYRQGFKIEHQLFGWTYLTHQGLMEQMMGVFIHHETYGTVLKVHCQNYTREYTYAIASGLSQNEAAWLAHEIQDWIYSDLSRLN